MNQTPQDDVLEDDDQPARAAGLARLTAIAKTALTQQYSILVYLIISFIIGQTIVVYFYYRTAALNHQTQEIQLARDLYREFYSKENGYLRVANAIEGCEKLYKSDGGKFSHLEINQYLGFFEDLGLFMERGALGEPIIGHFFGAFIIEAYEYPEVQNYIARIRKNFEQPEAFEDFDKVAKAVEADPRFARLAEFAETMCAEKQEGNQQK
ncbi:MAG: hypothetical protein R3D30_10750 [Hyphomicrobiales bacterium]